MLLTLFLFGSVNLIYAVHNFQEEELKPLKVSHNKVFLSVKFIKHSFNNKIRLRDKKYYKKLVCLFIHFI